MTRVAGEKIASRWRCRLVARVDTAAEAANAILNGTPVIGPVSLATEVHNACREAAKGEQQDGLDFVTMPEWNVFPAPKIAFRSGWGAPGTPIGSDDHLVMVSSFQEVIEDSSGARLIVHFHYYDFIHLYLKRTFPLYLNFAVVNRRDDKSSNVPPAWAGACSNAGSLFIISLARRRAALFEGPQLGGGSRYEGELPRCYHMVAFGRLRRAHHTGSLALESAEKIIS